MSAHIGYFHRSTQPIEVLFIALISVLVIFLTLESSILLLQIFVFYSKLKSPNIIRFLAVNTSIVFLNVAILFSSILGKTQSQIINYTFILGAFLFVGSVLNYLNGMVLGKVKQRSIALIFSALFVVIVLCLLAFGSGILSLIQITSLGTILLTIVLLSMYGFALFPAFLNQVRMILAIIVVFNMVSFTVYFAYSMFALVAFLNLNFVLLAVFHNVSLFRRLSISVRGRWVRGSSRLREELEDYGLSERQVEIAELFILGYSRSKIAEACNITEGTVRSHLTHIRRIVGASNADNLIDKFSNNL